MSSGVSSSYFLFPHENIADVISLEKTGIPRALEALEANDWANASLDDLGSDFEDIGAEIEAEQKRQKAGEGGEDSGTAPLDPEDLDFGYDPKDFEGLKRAIWNAGNEDVEDSADGEPSTAVAKGGKQTEEMEESLDDEDIQKIERMMVTLQAVRETNAGLPEEQRKRAAAKAVAEVMKEL